MSYLPPDYSELSNPNEEDELLEDLDDDDDDLDDIDEGVEENYIEQVERGQEQFNREILTQNNNNNYNMSDQPWKSFSSGGENKAPWEKPQPQANNFGSSWGNSRWGSNSNSWSGNGFSSFGQQPQQTDYSTNSKKKTILVVNALDCIVESYDSNGKPGIIPRSIFDLKPRFDVWERIASFNPTYIYILFPANGIIPSINDPEVIEVASRYLSLCIESYLRIPRRHCTIVKESLGTNKLNNIILLLGPNMKPDNILYLGVRSGRFGLSSEDKDAAALVNIDYMDLYNLLSGRYEYE